MKPEIEKGINLILDECERKGWVNINMCTPEAIHKAIPKAKTLEVIKQKGSNSFELTQKGSEAIKLGGISQYLNDLASKENKDELIQNLTIKQLKGNIFQIKWWWVILLINGIISGLFGFIAGNFELILGWFK